MTRRDVLKVGAAALLPAIPRALGARKRPWIPVPFLRARRCDRHRNLRKLMEHATHCHARWVETGPDSTGWCFRREVDVYHSGALHDVADRILPYGQTCWVILPRTNRIIRLRLVCHLWTRAWKCDDFDGRLCFVDDAGGPLSQAGD